MQLPLLRTQRFAFAIALFYLTFGFALYALADEFSLDPQQPQIQLLAASLLLSSCAMLVQARYHLQVRGRVLLTTLTLVPSILVVAYHARGSSLLGIFVYLLLQLVTLVLPWLAEPLDGEPATDLLDLVQGALQIGIVIFVLFSAFRGSDLGPIGDHPVILSAVGLIGAASLLWPRPIGRFTPHHLIRRMIGTAFALLVAASLLYAERYVSGVLALHLGLSLLLVGRVPKREPIATSISFGAADETSTERLAELWLWLMLVAAVLLALAESIMGSRSPSGLIAIFVLIVTGYIVVTQWLLPPLGTPGQRVIGHLVFLALAQGLLHAPSSQISLAMITPTVAICLLAARRFGRRGGYRMLLLILAVITAATLIDGAVTGRAAGLILSGLVARLIIGAGAGAFVVTKMAEQHRLLRDLFRTQERLQNSYSDLQFAHDQLLVQSQQLAVQSDELIAQGAELTKLANFDTLTGLLNRRRFDEVLAFSLAQTVDESEGGALLFIDLDGFKFINDRFGHKAGDRLLRTVAVLLKKSVREHDVVGRLGGDEFAILLSGADRQAATATAERVLRMLRDEQMVIDGNSILIRASVGVTLYPAHGLKSEELLANADVAMYAAKDAGRDAYSLYGDWHSGKVIPSAITMEREIRSALEGGRVYLYLQPILDLKCDRVDRYEALIRMVDSAGVLLQPGEFLPAAERHGLIDQIDRWVINAAAEILGRWGLHGLDFELAINLSGRAFRDATLPVKIADLLKAHQVQPERLMIEITETAAIANLERARGFIEDLRATGCRIAIDDFGVGFSSFSYLKHLPVDYLKIDGSFIRNLATDERDQHMVSAMVTMANGLGIKTTAEWVGDSDSVTLLRRFGVDSAQGYFVGRPEPFELSPARA